MDTGPDFELLKDAYAVIDGIPETAIALDQLQSARGPSLSRGTTCSPAGWLGLHPRFMQLGLRLSEDGKRLLFAGDADGTGTTAEIMAQLFGLPLVEAEHLFSEKRTYTLGDDTGLSDKRLWLREMREFLKAHGQISDDFEERLETRGPFADPVSPSQIRAI